MRTYSFKDVKGIIASECNFQVSINVPPAEPTHLILSIPQARILMGDAAVEEILKKPVLELKEEEI
jgi:hypothetical protein